MWKIPINFSSHYVFLSLQSVFLCSICFWRFRSGFYMGDGDDDDDPDDASEEAECFNLNELWTYVYFGWTLLAGYFL